MASKGSGSRGRRSRGHDSGHRWVASVRGSSGARGVRGGVAVTFMEQGTELRYQRASDVVDVFLVEDHGLFRQGLSELLAASDPALRITGAVHSAEEAVRQIPELLPDVVLMDLHLPGMSGTEAIR